MKQLELPKPISQLINPLKSQFCECELSSEVVLSNHKLTIPEKSFLCVWHHRLEHYNEGKLGYFLDIRDTA